jgi:hypothetical protein
MALSAPRRYKQDRIAMHLTAGVLLVAFLAMVTLVAKSPHRFIYDETFFANCVLLLHQNGFTPRFLNSLNAAPGPLSTVVQAIFEPLTRLRPVAMRFVNVFSLVVLALVLVAWLKRKGNDYWVAGCSVLVVPMTWVVAGMALSEISAMVFAALSLCLQLRGLDAFDAGRSARAWFLFAGVCLGIATWGRQPYLLLVGVPVLVALTEPRLRVPVAIFVGAAGGLAIPLFVIWRGFVAPSQHLRPGFSVVHGLLSFGYTGICFILLGARSRWLSGKVVLGLVALTMVANAWSGAFVHYPLRSLVERYLAPSAIPPYGNLAGSLLLSCGVLCLAVLLRIIWESRGDLEQLTVSAGLLCMAAAPSFDTHSYSSRYTAMSLPYLILAAQRWRQWRLETVMIAALGCGLGFLSLWEYFSSAR